LPLNVHKDATAPAREEGAEKLLADSDKSVASCVHFTWNYCFGMKVTLRLSGRSIDRRDAPHFCGSLSNIYQALRAQEAQM